MIRGSCKKTHQSNWSGDELPEIAANADLFLCECTFYQQRVPAHLNYAELEQHLQKLTCKQIPLTHLDDEMLAQQEKLKLTCAYDGMKLIV